MIHKHFGGSFVILGIGIAIIAASTYLWNISSEAPPFQTYYELQTTTFPDHALVMVTRDDLDDKIIRQRTLVPSVHAALPDLEQTHALALFKDWDPMRTRTDASRIYLWSVTPNSDVTEQSNPIEPYWLLGTGMLYAYDVRTNHFEKLPQAYRHRPWNGDVILSPDGNYFLSMYDDAKPDDEQTLYLIDLRDDSVRVIGTLSGNESFAGYPLHSTLTPAPYYFGASFNDDDTVSVGVFDMNNPGIEDTRNRIRTAQFSITE